MKLPIPNNHIASMLYVSSVYLLCKSYWGLNETLLNNESSLILIGSNLFLAMFFEMSTNLIKKM